MRGEWVWLCDRVREAGGTALAAHMHRGGGFNLWVRWRRIRCPTPWSIPKNLPAAVPGSALAKLRRPVRCDIVPTLALYSTL
jgi:hypothetical protein